MKAEPWVIGVWFIMALVCVAVAVWVEFGAVWGLACFALLCLLFAFGTASMVNKQEKESTDDH